MSQYLEFDDSPTPRQPRQWSWLWSMTFTLIVINIVVFCLQHTLLPRLVNPAYLALSLYGIKSGYIWQLITYQFMHGGIMHLVLNCWAFFIFGRQVEWAIGKTRFLFLYFASGIMGGLFQVGAALLWPEHFGGATVGASAGVFGVTAAFAMLFPEQELVLLVAYVIPVNIRAKRLLWVLLCLTALGISFPDSRLLGGNIAHFAHLGGALTGIAFCRFYFFRTLHNLRRSQ